MKFIIQSVKKAKVQSKLNKKRIIKQKIQFGLLIYVGISKYDIDSYQNKIFKFCNKIGNTKILKSSNNTISSTLKDIDGEILIISNFTLYGENNKGTKINFSKSAKFTDAKKIYKKLIEELSKTYKVKSGIFGKNMKIKSTNIGPLNYIWEY